MPPFLRNRTLAELVILPLCLALAACSQEEQLHIWLEAALFPDPFADVETVRVVGLVDGHMLPLETVRWDQGPRALEEPLPIDLDRVWVEGLSAEGRVVSAALSPALDLFDASRRELALLFARVGELSVAPGEVEPREGWTSVADGSQGVLLLGGLDAAGATPEATLRWTAEGAVEPGPSLPGGRWGGKSLEIADRVLVWGGYRSVDGVLEAAPEWGELERDGRWLTHAIDVEPGLHPALVAAGNRHALGVNRVTGEVEVLDVVDVRGRRAGAIAPGRSGAAVVRFGIGEFLAFGGASRSGGLVFDSRAGTTTATLAISVPGAHVGLQTAAETAVVLGEGAAWSIVPGFEATETATAVRFASAEALQPDAIWDAGGGVLLAATGTRALHRVELLGGKVEPITPLGVPFSLAEHPDGTLRGVADDGRLLVFSAGPSVFWPTMGGAWGITPRDPARWIEDGSAVQGTALVDGTTRTIATQTWATLGNREHERFHLEVVVEPVGRGRASLLFAIDDGAFAEVRLGRVTQIVWTSSSEAETCAEAEIPAFDEGAGAAAVALIRDGDELLLDVGLDGEFELGCTLARHHRGKLGLGVIRGSVRFFDLRLFPART